MKRYEKLCFTEKLVFAERCGENTLRRWLMNKRADYTLLGVLRGHAPAEGVVAYIPKAETCRDTSLLSEYSRAGGVPTPPLKTHQ
jgi:hypothetical protein